MPSTAPLKMSAWQSGWWSTSFAITTWSTLSPFIQIMSDQNRVTNGFKVGVELHQGSVLRLFLFVLTMDKLTDEVRQVSPWTIMLTHDIVMCSERRDQVQ